MSHLVSAGLLIIRVVLGLTVFAHGAQKLLGWFGGRGLAGEKAMIAGLGVRPVWLFAVLNTLGEFLGGLGLAAGFLTPFAAAGILGTMIVAVIKVHWPKGFFNHDGGLEYPLVLGATSFVLGLIGPGAYSLDAVLGVRLPWPETYIIVLLLMLIADIVAVIMTSPSRPRT
jgi:putative oxidoreductase